MHLLEPELKNELESNWLDQFKAKYGRIPRILHVGNIANNAYNNAKLLNEAGFNCDVICYDYYHIMGCPEWEDADFNGNVGDQFYPDWKKVDLRGFKRPDWFVQGPLWLCTKYLDARNRNLFSVFFWRLQITTDFHRRFIQLKGAVAQKIDPTRRRRSFFWTVFKNKCLHSLHWSLFQTLVSASLFVFSALWLVVSSFCLAVYILFKLLGWVIEWFHKVEKEKVVPNFDSRVAELTRCYELYFPFCEDRLTKEDFEPFRYLYLQLAKVMSHYDLIEGYATDPIYPMLLGTKPYVAYEHGTIRDIPFQRNAIGRLCALSYRMADTVIITNPDCIEAVRKLNLKNYRYVPHVLDKKYYNQTGLFDSSNSISVPGPYVFCPTRHDWDVKGIQHAIHGFSKFHKECPEYYLVMSRWGADAERSKELIRELDIEPYVLLVDPLKICDLVRVTRNAFALIDQFILFFGGIAPTALVVGTPLITNIEFSKCAWCYDEAPPYFQAKDGEGVFRALLDISKLNRKDYARKAREWVVRNYNYRDVISHHSEIYRDLLSSDKRIESKKEALLLG